MVMARKKSEIKVDEVVGKFEKNGLGNVGGKVVGSVGDNVGGNIPAVLSAGGCAGGLEIRREVQDIIDEMCKEIGMGLKDYLLVIQRGLSAKKMMLDKFGDEHLEDDMAVQLKAATMGLEVQRYTNVKINTEGVTNNYFDVKTLVQQFKEIK